MIRTYIAANLIFGAIGVVLIILGLLWASEISVPNSQEGRAPFVFILRHSFPFYPTVALGLLCVCSSAISVPVVGTSSHLHASRGWIKCQSWLMAVCTAAMLGMAMYLWATTLQTRATYASAWAQAPRQLKTSVQKELTCCGYVRGSGDYEMDDICPNDAAAALRQGCIEPINSFSNSFMGAIFTWGFGFVAVDAAILLCLAVILQTTKESKRSLAMRQRPQQRRQSRTRV